MERSLAIASSTMTCLIRVRPIAPTGSRVWPDLPVSGPRSATNAGRGSVAPSHPRVSATRWSGGSMSRSASRMGHQHHSYQGAGRLCLSGGRDRSLLPAWYRLLHAEPSDDRCCPAGALGGCVQAEAEEKGAGSLGLGLLFHEYGLGIIREGPHSRALIEPSWKLS